MAILTHGSDLALAPTTTPLVAQGDGTLRTALERVAAAGFEAVQLDATLAGLRPRDLSARARKDLVALLGRRGLRLAGLDLFLPRKHYIQPDHIDRAMAATLAAIELAADLGRAALSVAVPVAELAEDLRSALVEAADGRGVMLAVQGEGQWQALADWIDGIDLHALKAAIDPATLLAQQQDPVAIVHEHAKRIGVARLSDQSTAQAARSPVGQGDLDLPAYRIALDLATARRGPVVLDVRGLSHAFAAAAAAQQAWADAAFAV
jgi:sugar phosphate isomerase/epimerase